MSSTEQEVVARLRTAMFDAAVRVQPESVATRLPVTALVGQEDVTVQPRRRAAAPALAAAAVAALAAGVTVFAAGGHDSRPGGAGFGTQPAANGRAGGGFTYVVVTGPTETLQTWIPADRAGTWEFINSNMSGSGRTQRGACAAFPAYVDGNGTVPGCDGGSWTTYRPKFADSLPDDPHAVLASMRAAYRPSTDAETFQTGFNFVCMGWAQPEAVSKVVAALRLLRGVTATSHHGGRTTIAYSGQIKSTLLEHWSVTVDAGHRVVATSYSYGPTVRLDETITYRHVGRLGSA